MEALNIAMYPQIMLLGVLEKYTCTCSKMSTSQEYDALGVSVRVN